MSGPDAVLAHLSAASPWPDLEAICALGGRFAGSASEARARAFLAERLEALMGVAPAEHPVEYDGWTRGEASLEIAGARDARLRCESLVRSPATAPEGLDAEVVDLGRGTEADFERHAADLPGRIALVRHEYMFATGTVHRRRKYEWALAHGAAGFLIASHVPGELPVTGSSGARPGHGIPGAGISAESAARLAPSGGRYPRARLRIEATHGHARTGNLILDLPGRRPEWVVLCAHLDGHHLATSAMDNGTGLAAVLAAAGALAPLVARLERGLRVAFFTIEEWALAGSRLYVESLSPAELDAIAVVLNLDSVAGSARLTALTSGYPALESWLLATARAARLPLDAYRPLMQNSDHYSFAVRGVPAARLVAGFDEPDSNLRYVLTPGDGIDKVRPADLEGATRLAATLAYHACAAPDLALR